MILLLIAPADRDISSVVCVFVSKKRLVEVYRYFNLSYFTLYFIVYLVVEFESFVPA